MYLLMISCMVSKHLETLRPCKIVSHAAGRVQCPIRTPFTYLRYCLSWLLASELPVAPLGPAELPVALLLVPPVTVLSDAAPALTAVSTADHSFFMLLQRWAVCDKPALRHDTGRWRCLHHEFALPVGEILQQSWYALGRSCWELGTHHWGWTHIDDITVLVGHKASIYSCCKQAQAQSNEYVPLITGKSYRCVASPNKSSGVLRAGGSDMHVV